MTGSLDPEAAVNLCQEPALPVLPGYEELFPKVLNIYLHLILVFPSTCVVHLVHLLHGGHPQLGQGVAVEEAPGLEQEVMKNGRLYGSSSRFEI